MARFLFNLISEIRLGAHKTHYFSEFTDTIRSLGKYFETWRAAYTLMVFSTALKLSSFVETNLLPKLCLLGFLLDGTAMFIAFIGTQIRLMFLYRPSSGITK